MNSRDFSGIEQMLGHVDQLPTLPAVYKRLQQMLTDPKVSAREVGAVIEQDQALAAKLLKVVNSSYYSFPRQVTTISHSVVILGFNEIKHMALSVSLLKMFGNARAGTLFDQSGFWKHSLGVAVCAGAIGRKAGPAKCPSHEEAFVAGLLHDIGKIIEDQFLHDDFVLVLREQKKQDVRLIEAEKRILKNTHQDFGAFLAHKWRLPAILESTIGFHHDPLRVQDSESEFAMTSIIHCANIIARALAIGTGGDPYVPRLEHQCWEFLDLGTDDLEPIVDESAGVFNDMAKLLLEG
ncbi:MAG: HDOD domain-containing protein [Chitinivibrionales bacterium]|nr:HDOD domain-containing protein [Chitinivibrionales bacterium]